MNDKLPIETGFENSSSLPKQTHVKVAEVTGIRERTRGKKKQFVFVLNLIWSDGTSGTIWRSYSEFFDLQCKLLNNFAEEAGRGKRKVRTIPFLPVLTSNYIKIFPNLERGGVGGFSLAGREILKKSDQRLAEERRPKIAKYLNDLLLLPPHVSQSLEVFSFFHCSRDDPECFNQFPVKLDSFSDFVMPEDKTLDKNESKINVDVGQVNKSYTSSLNRDNHCAI
ncbi:predicted protein [Nematostella vectensis]|uniref:PX domain-containing protein n=1 Tax=Nematostella vectensis TaxID=45351 RepID=A7SI76_NEMVE|nr:predicted protein [Nematostella vectensis]|eukprot:XP_001628665.1 predicted protein [Nematostella vectensis]